MLYKTIEILKQEIRNNKKDTFVPLPLRNLLLNEDKILNIIKERESEITDEVSKFFSDFILNKKILMGISTICVYLFFSFLMLRLMYLLYIKITKHPFFETYLKKYNREDEKIETQKSTQEIIEMPEMEYDLIGLKNNLFLNSFFKSFTKLNENDYLDKIRQDKKLTKTCLVDIERVSNIRKGIDCIHDIVISDIQKYFYKNAKAELEILVNIFNCSDYFCPCCEKKLSDNSVLCEKCCRWFDKKCVKNIGSGPWYCNENKDIIIKN